MIGVGCPGLASVAATEKVRTLPRSDSLPSNFKLDRRAPFKGQREDDKARLEGGSRFETFKVTHLCTAAAMMFFCIELLAALLQAT